MKITIDSSGVPKLVDRLAEDFALSIKPLQDLLPKYPISGHLLSKDPNTKRGADIDITITP